MSKVNQVFETDIALGEIVEYLGTKQGKFADDKRSKDHLGEVQGIAWCLGEIEPTYGVRLSNGMVGNFKRCQLRADSEYDHNTGYQEE